MATSLPKDPNQLLLVDAGCEFEYYASDITRVFPLGGVFTEEQKIIYEIVLKANKVRYLHFK